MSRSASRLLAKSSRESLTLSMEKYKLALASPAGELCATYLADRGIPRWLAWEWELGYVDDPDPEHEDMRGRLAIPYVVPRGGPVGMKFRCIRPHDCGEVGHPKYLAHVGMGQRLFGVRALSQPGDTVAITEGELDAIVCSAEGPDDVGIPAVAVPGVKGWRDEWRFAFEGFPKVLIFGDGDKAGRAFASMLAERIHGSRAVHMPDGHDVTSFVLEYGADALRERAGL